MPIFSFSFSQGYTYKTDWQGNTIAVDQRGNTVATQKRIGKETKYGLILMETRYKLKRLIGKEIKLMKTVTEIDKQKEPIGKVIEQFKTKMDKQTMFTKRLAR